MSLVMPVLRPRRKKRSGGDWFAMHWKRYNRAKGRNNLYWLLFFPIVIFQGRLFGQGFSTAKDPNLNVFTAQFLSIVIY